MKGGVGDVGEDGLDFGSGEDDGETFVFLGAQGLDAGEFDVEHLFVEEEDGLHGDVLGAGGDVFGDGEMGEEGGDVVGAQITGVAEGAVWGPLEVDVAGDPVDVGLFGAIGVVFHAEDVADLVEKFGFGHCLPALRMRRLSYFGVDYTSNSRRFQILASNLRLNK